MENEKLVEALHTGMMEDLLDRYGDWLSISHPRGPGNLTVEKNGENNMKR